MPVFRAAGAQAADGIPVTPALPTGVAVDDICILVATCRDVDTISITTAGGGAWTALTGSPVNVTDGEKLYTWWRRHAGGDSAPTLTQSANYICAGIAAWYNCVASGSPIDNQETGNEDTADTTLSFATTISTAQNDCMVILCSSSDQDSNTPQHSSQANTNLASIAERMDYQTAVAAGGGFQCVEGQLVTAGAIGTWTATLAANSRKSYITFALKGLLAGGGLSIPVVMNQYRQRWA